MAATPEKRARRERWERLKADPAFLDNILNGVASGASVMRLIEAYDISYRTVMDWLLRDEGGRGDAYMRAREKRAQYFVQEIEHITADVVKEDGIDPKRAKVAGDNLRWLAARHDPHLWGEKQQITHNHQGAVSLHLTAVRELAAADRAGHGATYQHESTVIEHDSSDDELEGSELL